MFRNMLAAALLFPAAAWAAPDPVALASDNYKVLLENERVRVIEFTLKPKQKVPLHRHPDYVMHALTPFKVRFTDAAGHAKEFEGPAGLTVYSESLEHADENIGTADFRVLIFELK